MKYFLYCRKSTESEDRQVASLDSQRAELRRAFGASTEIEIVEVFEESKSAKAPGRPLFGQMVQRIEAGEAQGIVAWAPDRLARNSIDGGRLVYLLDRGVLRDLKFATYTFENNPQGKFMLAIMFGQSKYYSDALSENVQRGFRAKVEKGWRPGKAPIGYLTDPRTREIIPDPERFHLVQDMFRLMRTGNYSVRRLAILARDEWGFRMPGNRQSKGEPVTPSAIFKLLHNPFYAGAFLWNAKLHQGAHQPMVSWDELKAVAAILQEPGTPRRQKHVFAFTGLIRCGGCGRMITAEQKVKPSGRRYTYYHCVKHPLGPRCPQPAVREDILAAQITAFVGSLTIPFEIEDQVLAWIGSKQEDRAILDEARQASLLKARAANDAETREVTRLRLRQLLTDEEFTRERERLAAERMSLDQAIAAPEVVTVIELATELMRFSKYAVEWLRRADPLTKRDIVKIVGSNPLLEGGKLSIQAAKPFQLTLEMAECFQRCGLGNDVRTISVARATRDPLRALEGWINADPKRGQKLLGDIHKFENQCQEEDVGLAA